MSFAEKLYIPAVLQGMGITMRHAAKTVFGDGTATIQYPEEVRPRVKIWRGEHVLKRDDEGRERCTACGLCAVACPCLLYTSRCV